MTDIITPHSSTPTTGVNPGKKLGVIGLILAFPFQLIGLIVSIVALRKSTKAGFKNPAAIWGIVVGLVGTITLAIIIAVAVAAVSASASFCAENGAGVFENNGVTITCGE
jgi:heme/copper-type cytochrome/quinol oxidase subunit 1